MAQDDKPVWFDFNNGVLGRFQAFHQHVGDPGMVIVEYAPFNSLLGKDRYSRPIPKNMIETLYPTEKKQKGVPDSIMVCKPFTKDALIMVINEKMQKTIDELNNKVYDLELEIRTLRQQLETAQSGVKKYVSEAQDINRGSRPRTGFGAFGIPGAGDEDYYGGSGL